MAKRSKRYPITLKLTGFQSRLLVSALDAIEGDAAEYLGDIADTLAGENFDLCGVEAQLDFSAYGKLKLNRDPRTENPMNDLLT